MSGQSGQNGEQIAWWQQPLLRRVDQACAAVLVGTSLLAIGGMWYARGGHRGRLVDIERAQPLSIEFKLDVNAADWPELTLLPNIGEMLARRIVEARRAEGPFTQHEDLLRVKGIGPKTLEAIRPYLLPVAAQAEPAGSA